MDLSRSAEREIEQLEKQLERAVADGDDAEAKAIRAEIRDIERDASERDRWEEEGQERGWF